MTDPQELEYEEERPPEWCKYCEHYEYDSWYPGERVCANKYGPQYGLTVDAFERCDWWEVRQE